MKTTRLKLVEFLEQKFKEGFRINSYYEYYELADKLIESGLVEIEEEPKEWWIWKNKDGWRIEENQTLEVIDSYGDKQEIIHVHSVDQCHKYEKMWNELRRKVLEVRSSHKKYDEVCELMEQLEKGE